MADVIDTVLFGGEGTELEIITAIAPSGRMGVEVYTATATSPQEPEAIAAVRDVLTSFLVRNGYE